jgi:hypothetical protein
MLVRGNTMQVLIIFLQTFGKTQPPFYYKDGSIDDLLLTGISPPEVSKSYSTVVILDYKLYVDVSTSIHNKRSSRHPFKVHKMAFSALRRIDYTSCIV